jgi:hypothetical protein
MTPLEMELGIVCVVCSSGANSSTASPLPSADFKKTPRGLLFGAKP